MSPRHLTSINDLSNEEMQSIFRTAENYLHELGDPHLPSRIAKSTGCRRGSVMATLFYEPSTRTRLSFESAMLRLGGQVISTADAGVSSAAKGESLADSIRIVSAYADILVLRHPREGAAKLAAEYAEVPVINAGDGAHEHPTQTLCDLFTILHEKGTLTGLNVAILGDLMHGRTVHSLVYGLARFGATITIMPASGFDLPESVERRLLHEFAYQRATGTEPASVGQLAATYLPQGQTRRALPDLDVLYVTRLQKERAAERSGTYPVVNAAFLSAPTLKHTLVMHPLPRVGELDPALDTDSRATYFRQASYGVPVRMALITWLCSEGAAEQTSCLANAQCHGFLCANSNCISRDPAEAQSAPSKSVENCEGHVRCFYCAHDTADAG